MSAQDYQNLSQPGLPAAVSVSPDKAILERMQKPFSQYDYLVRMARPKFTSIRPVTGRPGFARIVRDYVPHEWIVESKSLSMFYSSTATNRLRFSGRKRAFRPIAGVVNFLRPLFVPQSFP